MQCPHSSPNAVERGEVEDRRRKGLDRIEKMEGREDGESIVLI